MITIVSNSRRLHPMSPYECHKLLQYMYNRQNSIVTRKYQGPCTCTMYSFTVSYVTTGCIFTGTHTVVCWISNSIGDNGVISWTHNIKTTQSHFGVNCELNPHCKLSHRASLTTETNELSLDTATNGLRRGINDRLVKLFRRSKHVQQQGKLWWFDFDKCTKKAFL